MTRRKEKSTASRRGSSAYRAIVTCPRQRVFDLLARGEVATEPPDGYVDPRQTPEMERGTELHAWAERENLDEESFSEEETLFRVALDTWRRPFMLQRGWQIVGAEEEIVVTVAQFAEAAGIDLSVSSDLTRWFNAVKGEIVSCRLDMRAQDSDGVSKVFDYKTGAAPKTAATYQNDHQIVGLAVLAEIQFQPGQPINTVWVEAMNQQPPWEFKRIAVPITRRARINAAQVYAFGAVIENAVKGRDPMSAPPTGIITGGCYRCPHKDKCL